MDTWHGCLSLSRQYLKGWSGNKASENRKPKENVLKELAILDEKRRRSAGGVGALGRKVQTRGDFGTSIL
jgi:hypothetical protein